MERKYTMDEIITCILFLIAILGVIFFTYIAINNVTTKMTKTCQRNGYEKYSIWKSDIEYNDTFYIPCENESITIIGNIAKQEKQQAYIKSEIHF